MNYYTHDYNKQQSLEGFPEVRLYCVANRWICCQFRESLGRNGWSYTLVDNYGTSYLLELNYVDGQLVLTSNTLSIDDRSIHLPPHTFMKHPFPDFLIDVLQTISVPLAFETLSRVAERFAKITERDRDGSGSGSRVSAGEF